MKLREVKIHNFRGILDLGFESSNYSLLVGANNAGKSSVIDAIRAFYEKDGFKFKNDNDFPFVATGDKESWIELSFGLSEEENNSLKDEYQTQEKTLRVRKYFQTASQTHDDKTAAGFIFAYRTDGTLSNEPFYGAKNVQSGKFGDIVYVPAVSKVDDHAKLTGPSALRDLLTDIMADVVEGGKAHGELTESIQMFAKRVLDEKTTDNRSLSGFEAEFNKLLTPWQSEFKLKFPPPSAPEIVKNMLGWDLFDKFHGKPQAIEYSGSGFQRHFIYSLIQLGSRYIRKKVVKKAKDFSPSMVLLLFEEPEAFLHPPQQDVLARSLMALATADNWQVLCATHSPRFVSKNTEHIPEIIRMHRTASQIEKFQISVAGWRAIVEANQAIMAIAEKHPKFGENLHEDDAKPEMEIVKHFLWLNPDRCSLFFANFVLLVEGPTEAALINKLQGEGKIVEGDVGLYVLDCLGKYNIHRFMNLLSNLGITHSVLHDDDKNKDEHADINKLIADSNHPTFTKKIVQIQGNLETLLAVPRVKSPHRKPQHILYLYESGQIDAAKVQLFCELVHACLS